MADLWKHCRIPASVSWWIKSRNALAIEELAGEEKRISLHPIKFCAANGDTGSPIITIPSIGLIRGGDLNLELVQAN